MIYAPEANLWHAIRSNPNLRDSPTIKNAIAERLWATLEFGPIELGDARLWVHLLRMAVMPWEIEERIRGLATHCPDPWCDLRALRHEWALTLDHLATGAAVREVQVLYHGLGSCVRCRINDGDLMQLVANLPDRETWVADPRLPDLSKRWPTDFRRLIFPTVLCRQCLTQVSQ